MYNRILQSELLRLSELWSIISITGPRQSGKTTLCKMAFPDYAYVNMEHFPTRDLALSDMEAFLNQYPNGLIIDEAQNIPEIFSYLQVRVDANKKLRYILSGSSDFLLMQGISQSLAGRVAVRRLLPLSISELGESLNAYSTDDTIIRGFYPAVWGEPRMPKDVYESYFETYIERDVRQIISVQNISAFCHFMKLCAGRIGSEFNASTISCEVGVSNQTITNWISVLETSYTAFRLHPYYSNIGKRLSKTPKIYFYDVGLAAWLLGIRNADDLKLHPLRGQLFENMIVVEFIKKAMNRGDVPSVYFYRDRSQHEVDVIVENSLSIDAYEIKSGKTYHKDWENNLDYLQNILNEKLHSSSILYDGENERQGLKNAVLNYKKLFL